MDMQTTISRVTVFRDGARVVRTGKATLDKGPQKVVISDITEFAQEDSFRVKGSGPGALASIDVSYKERIFKPKKEIEKLKKELEALQKEYEAVSDELEIHTARLTNVDQMVKEFSDHFGMVYAADEGDITQLTEIDEASSKLNKETTKKIRDLREKLKEIQEQITVIRGNIGDIESDRRIENYFEVEVSLEMKEKGEIVLETTYQCNGAGWTPNYDVDLVPKKANLRRIAMVKNQTREDWDKVNLVVSTATAKPVEAIEASPYIISVYHPPKPKPAPASGGKRMRKAAKRMDRVAAIASEPARPPAPEPEPMIEEFADASEGASGITYYELPKPVSIPSDDERHPVTLTEETLDSRSIHYWYADGMAEVVAQDEVTNGDNVILPGKVKVYADGDYIGETSIDLISPREEFKIGTRTAYDVKATKKLVDKQMEKAGITRGKLKRGYKYRLEIENFSKQEITIEIRDRVPHSLNPAIEVKVDWEQLELESKDLGVMKWEEMIESGEKHQIEYQYEVEWEKDVTISPPLP
ncbi:MAG: mucoidy inhibitor MuiA family protein [Candidatus Lokiarchaeota archaeon]|nr:mucoidy inhibitor MuiA family protein [Candidatus Lokiarchaeota archaeon]